MYHRIIENINPLGFNWTTRDPFLFCVHHLDHYPKGNSRQGPDASLAGRQIGQDFTPKDGWRMYHGKTIPGFPAHPHRGFETVTILVNGWVDHFDSHGAAGRYGNGDVQWMTAGAGLQHCEMFPLPHSDKENPLELFQIWLNLPRAKKFANPHYKMLWSEKIPEVSEDNGKVFIRVIAGKYGTTTAVPPAPDSWAADTENHIAIWLIRMAPNSEWTLPAAPTMVNRSLYFYRGGELTIGGIQLPPYHSAEMLPQSEAVVRNGKEEAFLLLLQGKPIGEPVVQRGPFVMNTMSEIKDAFADFSINQFGGWPWPDSEIVHPPEQGRMALYSDGTSEIPG
jgi:redox-sensitive bicupin YhaK (pirin superfamily)